MFNVTFDEFCDMLLPLSSLSSPSELHGFLCGKLCGGARLSHGECVQQAWDLLDVPENPDATFYDCISTLYDATLNDMSSGDYAFQPLLPDDDSEIAVRTQALAQWAQGFLIGFGAAGIDPNTEFSSDNADALRDLAKITQVAIADADLLNEDNDQESDYFELTEYVRIVALTLYSEYAEQDVSVDEQQLKGLH